MMNNEDSGVFFVW